MIVKREEWLKQLEIVSAGLSPREIIEQSSCFIFQNGKVKTYNDEISCSFPSVLKIRGAVQAIPLISLLRKLKEDELEVLVNKAELLIKGKNRKAGISMDEKITLPISEVEKPKKWRRLPKNFTDAISVVHTCAGTNEAQFSMTCVHLVSDFMEACDNYQAIRYKIKIPLTKEILVRGESIKHLRELDVTKFCKTKRWIHFKNKDGLVLSCRHSKDKYKDLNNAFEVTGSPLELPKTLKNAIEKAEVFSIDNPAGSNIVVSLKKNRVKITGRGSTGWFTETKRSKYKGKALQFIISARLLYEIIEKYDECLVSANRLKIKSKKFDYVTVLGKVDE